MEKRVKKVWKKASDYVPLLILLSEIGATKNFVRTSSKKIAEVTAVSQQTASRHLKQLEEEGLIIRKNVDKTGQALLITKEGLRILSEIYAVLGRTLQPERETFEISGYVITGLGEGAYYMTREPYVQQFTEKLSFKPWPGTLNLKLDEIEDLKNFIKLRAKTPIIIKGFKTKERIFGDVDCHPVKINEKVDGTIIIPTRTHHNSKIMEVVAPINLREKFKLKDGMKVTVKTIL
ncbi:MAG: DUF120 domain-containing protein [Candidatus Wukongarchaeota archaeon]|nr:DUF120 domain-containing protein [Candidatus Wukongarchaeota archaeon]